MEYPQTQEERESLRKHIVEDMKARRSSGETGLDALIAIAECQHEFERVGYDGELLFCPKCKFFKPS